MSGRTKRVHSAARRACCCVCVCLPEGTGPAGSGDLCPVACSPRLKSTLRGCLSPLGWAATQEGRAPGPRALRAQVFRARHWTHVLGCGQPVVWGWPSTLPVPVISLHLLPTTSPARGLERQERPGGHPSRWSSGLWASLPSPRPRLVSQREGPGKGRSAGPSGRGCFRRAGALQ